MYAFMLFCNLPKTKTLQQHSPTTIRDLATSDHSSNYLTQHTIIIVETNHAYEYIYIYVSYAWQWQWQWQWHVML